MRQRVQRGRRARIPPGEKALSLLERKQYVEFFKTSVRPSELEELAAKLGSVEKVASDYGQTDRPIILAAVLKAALSVEPTFTADGSRATFTFAEPVRGARRLSLQRIEGRWYLRN